MVPPKTQSVSLSPQAVEGRKRERKEDFFFCSGTNSSSSSSFPIKGWEASSSGTADPSPPPAENKWTFLNTGSKVLSRLLLTKKGKQARNRRY